MSRASSPEFVDRRRRRYPETPSHPLPSIERCRRSFDIPVHDQSYRSRFVVERDGAFDVLGGSELLTCKHIDIRHLRIGFPGVRSARFRQV